jgi:hypothetical protein
MATVTLSDALNNPANTLKTAVLGADKPVEYDTLVWDDLRFSFTQTRRGANLKPGFDETNIGLLFEQNKAADKLYIIAQFPHQRKNGFEVRPHIHWQQSNATPPVWKMDYKWIINGQTVPETFETGVPQANQIFTYTSGNLAQISRFPAITPPANDNISAMLLIRLYRDDNIAIGDVLAWEFDIHYAIDDAGSQHEYTK